MKSVVICGSTRFKTEAVEFAKKLRELGVVVCEPNFNSGEGDWNSLSDDFKKFAVLGLTHEHFYKIQMADAVFIFNKDGYVGVSVTLEIGYAVGAGKPIYALNGDDELARQVLIREAISSPEELVRRLQ